MLKYALAAPHPPGMLGAYVTLVAWLVHCWWREHCCLRHSTGNVFLLCLKKNYLYDCVWLSVGCLKVRTARSFFCFFFYLELESQNSLPDAQENMQRAQLHTSVQQEAKGTSTDTDTHPRTHAQVFIVEVIVLWLLLFFSFCFLIVVMIFDLALVVFVCVKNVVAVCCCCCCCLSRLYLTPFPTLYFSLFFLYAHSTSPPFPSLVTLLNLNSKSNTLWESKIDFSSAEHIYLTHRLCVRSGPRKTHAVV